MIPRDELHVVFGTGPVGLAVMRELHGQGKRVRLVNRSGTASAPQSVEVVKGNWESSFPCPGLALSSPC
jgi:2-polyprenyl-6-methoxyphenol hydroxylase-like FAD-dependent oxidoreductase